MPQIIALGRLGDELDARLASVGGLDTAGELATRIRAVFADLSVADVERMTRQVTEMERQMEAFAHDLAALRELKRRLEQIDE